MRETRNSAVTAVVSAIGLVLTLLATTFQGTANAVPAQPEPASIVDRGHFGQSGRWLVDGSGRVVLSAGVNLVNKHSPYTAEGVGFNLDDVRWLATNGFDSVRLGIIWKAIEPTPGHYDDTYLASIRRTIDLLASQGISTLVDAHQDMYNERFQGEFAPDWAVLDDGLPDQPRVGFPANQAVNAGLLRAYDNFLANRRGPGGVGLVDRFAAMWHHVAAYLRPARGILGYDLLNEPWPGSAYLGCVATLGACSAARERLDVLNSTVSTAIAAADPDAISFYEPYSIWNDGIDIRPARPTGTAHAALSWHDYCPVAALLGSYTGCAPFDGRTFANADRAALDDHVGSLLTEFGATDDAPTLRAITDAARAHLVGWQYWAYCDCSDPTTQDRDAQGIVGHPQRPGPVRPDDVNTAKLAILAAPHVRAVAGTPLRTRWVPGTGTYTAAWTPRRADETGWFDAHTPTEVAVPAVDFPHGFHVTVTGGHITARRDGRLFIVADTHAPVGIEITASPAAEG